MRTNEYDIGDEVRVSAAFQSLANVLTDPTTVTVKVKDPANAITSYVYGTDEELVKDSTGMYHLDVTPDQSGTWYYRFASTGTVTAAEEKSFLVRESNF